MKCIYCNLNKEEKEFSLEHIFPTALGGKKLNDNLFKTRKVCRDCNSKMGLFVDALFLKSFFVKGSMSNDYLNYLDFNDDKSTLPFIYLGKNESVTHSDYDYCDYWNWAGGSRIFHFHNNYFENFESLAGGNPIKHKNNKTAGEAYLVSSTNNLIWIKKLLLSFKEHFKYAKRFSVNIAIQNENNILNIPSTQQQSIINSILQVSNGTQHNKIVLQNGFEVRFLAKMALALGDNLLDTQYICSNYARQLQNIIFEKDINKIADFEPKISNFFQLKNENIFKLIAWKGGHTILFLPIQNSLILHLSLFGSEIPLLTTITDELEKFDIDLVKKYPNGWVYIFIPQRGIFKGPYSFPAYIAYSQGDKSFMEDLTDIENLYINFEDLPPFVVDQDE